MLNKMFEGDSIHYEDVGNDRYVFDTFVARIRAGKGRKKMSEPNNFEIYMSDGKPSITRIDKHGRRHKMHRISGQDVPEYCDPIQLSKYIQSVFVGREIIRNAVQIVLETIFFNRLENSTKVSYGNYEFGIF